MKPTMVGSFVWLAMVAMALIGTAAAQDVNVFENAPSLAECKTFLRLSDVGLPTNMLSEMEYVQFVNLYRGAMFPGQPGQYRHLPGRLQVTFAELGAGGEIEILGVRPGEEAEPGSAREQALDNICSTTAAALMREGKRAPVVTADANIFDDTTSASLLSSLEAENSANTTDVPLGNGSKSNATEPTHTDGGDDAGTNSTESGGYGSNNTDVAPRSDTSNSTEIPEPGGSDSNNTDVAPHSDNSISDEAEPISPQGNVTSPTNLAEPVASSSNVTVTDSGETTSNSTDPLIVVDGEAVPVGSEVNASGVNVTGDGPQANESNASSVETVPAPSSGADAATSPVGDLNATSPTPKPQGTEDNPVAPGVSNNTASADVPGNQTGPPGNEANPDKDDEPVPEIDVDGNVVAPLEGGDPLNEGTELESSNGTSTTGNNTTGNTTGSGTNATAPNGTSSDIVVKTVNTAFIFSTNSNEDPMDVLNEAFADFVAQLVMTIGKQTPPVRRLRGRVWWYETRRLVVTVDQQSAEVYNVSDTDFKDCPASNATCKTALARYDLLLQNEQDPDAVVSRYQNDTAAAVDDGLLQKSLVKVDPNGTYLVEGSTEVPATSNAATQPPASATNATNATNAPKTNATFASTAAPATPDSTPTFPVMIAVIIGIVAAIAVLAAVALLRYCTAGKRAGGGTSMERLRSSYLKPQSLEDDDEENALKEKEAADTKETPSDDDSTGSGSEEHPGGEDDDENDDDDEKKVVEEDKQERAPPPESFPEDELEWGEQAAFEFNMSTFGAGDTEFGVEDGSTSEKQLSVANEDNDDGDKANAEGEEDDASSEQQQEEEEESKNEDEEGEEGESENSENDEHADEAQEDEPREDTFEDDEDAAITGFVDGDEGNEDSDASANADELESQEEADDNEQEQAPEVDGDEVADSSENQYGLETEEALREYKEEEPADASEVATEAEEEPGVEKGAENNEEKDVDDSVSEPAVAEASEHVTEEDQEVSGGVVSAGNDISESSGLGLEDSEHSDHEDSAAEQAVTEEVKEDAVEEDKGISESSGLGIEDSEHADEVAAEEVSEDAGEAGNGVSESSGLGIEDSERADDEPPAEDHKDDSDNDGGHEASEASGLGIEDSETADEPDISEAADETNNGSVSSNGFGLGDSDDDDEDDTGYDSEAS